MRSISNQWWNKNAVDLWKIICKTNLFYDLYRQIHLTGKRWDQTEMNFLLTFSVGWLAKGEYFIPLFLSFFSQWIKRIAKIVMLLTNPELTLVGLLKILFFSVLKDCLPCYRFSPHGSRSPRAAREDEGIEQVLFGLLRLLVDFVSLWLNCFYYLFIYFVSLWLDWFYYLWTLSVYDLIAMTTYGLG